MGMSRALPGSGAITMAQVRTELKLSGPITLGQSQVRDLAGRPSGSISMSHLHGKSFGMMLTIGVTSGSYPDIGFNIAQGAGNLVPNTFEDCVFGNMRTEYNREGPFYLYMTTVTSHPGGLRLYYDGDKLMTWDTRSSITNSTFSQNWNQGGATEFRKWLKANLGKTMPIRFEFT